MIQLKDKELCILAELADIPVVYMKKIYDMRIINESIALDYIMKQDFQRIKRKGKYKSSQIIRRIAQEYCVSESKAANAVYSKRIKKYYCEKCRRVISASQYKNHNKLCDDCIVKSIKI